MDGNQSAGDTGSMGDNEESGQVNDTGYDQSVYAQYEENLCRKCKTRTIDTSNNPDSVLCRQCREELIKLKIPKPIVAISILALILICVSFIQFPANLKQYAKFTGSDSVAKDGHILTAMDDLVNLLEEYPDNKDLAIRLADIGMKYVYYDYAAYAIDNYLVGKEVSDSEFDKLDGYMDTLDIYYATSDLLNQAIKTSGMEEIYSEEDYINATDKCSEILSGYLNDSGYDQALLNYYLAQITTDESKSIAYLEKCVELEPYYFSAQAMLAVYYRREGNLDKAREILYQAVAVNKEDYYVNRAIATLELTDGNLQEGLFYAELCYDEYPEGEYVLDTYAVALNANGKTEEAKALISEAEQNGYVFEDDFYSFMEGNMTLEEYYITE